MAALACGGTHVRHRWALVRCVRCGELNMRALKILPKTEQLRWLNAARSKQP